MGRMILGKKYIRILTLAIIFIILLGFYGLLLIHFSKKSDIDFRSLRIDLNEYTTSLENQLSADSYQDKADYSSLDQLKNNPYSCLLIDLKGKILWTKDITTYQVDDTFPIRSLSGIATTFTNNYGQYIFPILIHKSQRYTLIIKVPLKNYRVIRSSYYLLPIPIIILVLLSISLIFYFMNLSNQNIFRPISALHKSTENILNGNLEIPLSYDYEDEIGTLCHDFEMMRDQLQTSNKNEKALKENEKLLLACISHDLKTPLSSISGYVEGIRDGIVHDEEGIRHYTSIILKKVGILSKLIDDIMDHSKLELNEFTINLKEVYSRKYFTELFSDVSIDVLHYGLQFELSEVPDYLINIDEKRIRQVVYNIISNSLKYTEPGEKISVRFFTSQKDSKEELVISIQDTGKGISAADLPFIFDKFYRGEKARTLNVAGSGLGLNIAKNIVAKHGGRIECDSILNVGTTIMFSLPL